MVTLTYKVGETAYTSSFAYDKLIDQEAFDACVRTCAEAFKRAVGAVNTTKVVEQPYVEAKRTLSVKPKQEPTPPTHTED